MLRLSRAPKTMGDSVDTAATADPVPTDSGRPFEHGHLHHVYVVGVRVPGGGKSAAARSRRLSTIGTHLVLCRKSSSLLLQGYEWLAPVRFTRGLLNPLGLSTPGDVHVG